jgi:hypothetical protein
MSVSFKNQFDIPEVFQVYESEKNFEIIRGDASQSQDCYLFFSSHGIYYPNTSEEFRTKIIENNRFEWKRNIPKNYQKVFFLRDVLKQWYLGGINREIDSVEKIVEFLRRETQGLKITCVGSSGGGYAAALFGSLLKAERVFDFSGRFSLWFCLAANRELNPLLVKHEADPTVNQYFDIVDLIKSNSTPIFYFYPGKCQDDIEQSKLVKGISNVYAFKFNDRNHGCTVLAISMTDLFDFSCDQLVELHQKNQNQLLNSLAFSFRVSGSKKTIRYLLDKTLKKAKNQWSKK